MKKVAPQNNPSSTNRVQKVAILYVAAIPEALDIVSRCVLILALIGLAVEHLK